MEDTIVDIAALEKGEINQNLVQIKAANEEEVQRRINAFIQSKRSEVDERNVREFISPFSADIGNSCARVEAVYVHREGQKSHISLKRVDNVYGPQTQQSANEYTKPSHVRLTLDLERREAVEERLSNMESHLQLYAGHGGIYQRIKALEGRIMFLEGLSPEYFTKGIPSSSTRQMDISISRDDDDVKKTSQPSYLQNESLSNINKRIEQLKQTLKSKSDKRFSD